MKTPTTIAEAYQEFDKLFATDPETKENFTKLEQAKDVIQYHHTIGRWLRNNWELWQGGALAQLLITWGIKHPDDMSHVLLKGYWNHCNGVEYTYCSQENSK